VKEKVEKRDEQGICRNCNHWEELVSLVVEHADHRKGHCMKEEDEDLQPYVTTGVYSCEDFKVRERKGFPIPTITIDPETFEQGFCENCEYWKEFDSRYHMGDCVQDKSVGFTTSRSYSCDRFVFKEKKGIIDEGTLMAYDTDAGFIKYKPLTAGTSPILTTTIDAIDFDHGNLFMDTDSVLIEALPDYALSIEGKRAKKAALKVEGKIELDEEAVRSLQAALMGNYLTLEEARKLLAENGEQKIYELRALGDAIYGEMNEEKLYPLETLVKIYGRSNAEITQALSGVIMRMGGSYTRLHAIDLDSQRFYVKGAADMRRHYEEMIGGWLRSEKALEVNIYSNGKVDVSKVLEQLEEKKKIIKWKERVVNDPRDWMMPRSHHWLSGEGMEKEMAVTAMQEDFDRRVEEIKEEYKEKEERMMEEVERFKIEWINREQGRRKKR
jgi:hypothetical protein